MDGISGKTISIISYDDIRYVGIINGIDGENKIITISNVRVFGTEDRVTDPTKWILPRPEIYPTIQLNGDSVKSLNILESNVNEIQPVLLPGMQQPFVLPGMSQIPQMPQMPGMNMPQQTHQTQQPEQTTPVVNQQQQQQPASASGSSVENRQEKEKVSEPIQEQVTKEDAKSKPQPETTEKDTSKQGIVDSRSIAKSDTDFDFSENNAKFEKDSTKPTLDAGVSYNKNSSFFDDLSSSITDRSSDRMTWTEEKSLNEDTFGQASLGNGRGRGGYRGRGFRGRGRGGRGRGRGGRGRGRGRGGFNNGDNNNNNNNNNNQNYRGNNSYNSQPEWAF